MNHGGDRILQAMLLGALLENPKRLEHTHVNDFADSEFSGIVAALKEKDTSPLREFLSGRGVEWETGRAIEAVVCACQKQFDKLKALHVGRRAKYLLFRNSDELRTQLQQCLEELTEGLT